MSDAPMFQVKNLEAWYGESHVLHGVEFSVGEGEVVTLLGRNGAGKTTTMKSIMGLVPKRRGSIVYRGRETVRMRPDEVAKAGIAICPEERGIFSSLNVTENLMLPPVIGPGRPGCPHYLHAVPQPEGTRQFTRHQAVGWRAADAGDRPHPAHRRAVPVAWTSRPRGWPR